MRGDFHIDQLRSDRLEPLQYVLLARPHQARVTRYVSGEDRGKATLRGHSSGIPASRRPAKKVASDKARTFGGPKGPTTLKRAMLEYRASLCSLRASASSAAARSVSPLRA